MAELVSVPDPKPTPAWIAFSIARGEGLGLDWKRYTCRMRSGDETRLNWLVTQDYEFFFCEIAPSFCQFWGLWHFQSAKNRHY